MPFLFQERLLNSSRTALKPKKYAKLLVSSNIDGLCMILITRRISEIRNIASFGRSNDSSFNMEACKLLIRMLSVNYPDAEKFGVTLINTVSALFNTNNEPLLARHFELPVADNNYDAKVATFLPFYLEQMQCQKSCASAFWVYKRIASIAKLNLPSFITEKNQLDFLSLLRHFDIHELTSKLVKADEENVYKLNREDELFKILEILKPFRNTIS